MSSSRRIDVICLVGALLALMLTVLFMNGEALGLQSAGSSLGYENRLFNPETVHTLAIAIDDWDGFLETCADEEYTPCSVVIDGEAWKNVAIRGKGNTSLSNMASMDSNRYSFKIEFDHYENRKSYHGLDKLCLNNIIQDNTYMKDFLTYRLMAEEGAAAPLCSYVYITVNGEDWGLYLAVEGVEDSFLLRNYGADSGELYKPDSMNGGGPGNGRSFDMENFLQERGNRNGTDNNSSNNSGTNSDGAFGGFPMFPMETNSDGTLDSTSGGTFDLFQRFGSFGGGMGNSDVKLQYIDDDPDSYSDIFGNAKTDITEADQARLIAALKRLSDGEDLENTLDIDAVLRYFVAHNFVVNGDSYTGSMIHNYYLHENGGRLSMIPWDYNLAFGGFQGGSASGSVLYYRRRHPPYGGLDVPRRNVYSPLSPVFPGISGKRGYFGDSGSGADADRAVCGEGPHGVLYL